MEIRNFIDLLFYDYRDKNDSIISKIYIKGIFNFANGDRLKVDFSKDILKRYYFKVFKNGKNYSIQEILF